jgi:hypothetical protein
MQQRIAPTFFVMDRFRIQVAFLLSMLLIVATEHSTGWLSAWSSHDAFPARGLLVQCLYLGHPAVLLFIAVITWWYWRNLPMVRRLVLVGLIHWGCSLLPSDAILLPGNFLTPVVAIVWSVSARFPASKKYALIGWGAMTIVAMASMGILQLHWFWLGVQWTFGVLLGQMVHVGIQRVGYARMRPRKATAVKWQWRPSDQHTAHPAW